MASLRAQFSGLKSTVNAVSRVLETAEFARVAAPSDENSSICRTVDFWTGGGEIRSHVKCNGTNWELH